MLATSTVGTGTRCPAPVASSRHAVAAPLRPAFPRHLSRLPPQGSSRGGQKPRDVSRRFKSESKNNHVPWHPEVKQPPEKTLAVWRNASVVCFDVDCTLTTRDSLEMLAEFMGVDDDEMGTEEYIKNMDKDGRMNLDMSPELRLQRMQCTVQDIQAFLDRYPPEDRIAPGAKELIKALQARGVVVYLMSGGFRELTLPIAKYLGIPRENVFANKMRWEWDEASMQPMRLIGLDGPPLNSYDVAVHESVQDLTAARGKIAAVAQLRERHPYKGVVVIGDGLTDLEAVEETGGVDIFIGYGGVAEREAVRTQADWYIYDFGELRRQLKKHTVAMVGSGAWACAAVRMVGQNLKLEDPADLFHETVKMWVFEEEVDGRRLTDVINETHENTKYLPGISLPDNVVADSDLERVVKEADVLIFCVPHQFVHGICKQLQGKVRKDAIAVSLTKGMRVRPDGPQLISEMISSMLSIDCSVLMGANLAVPIGEEELSESTIGFANLGNAELLRGILERPYFGIECVPDVAGVEMAGTLKNIIAMGAGMIQGVGLGPNSVSTIMRAGLKEMTALSQALYPTVREDTFWKGPGMADTIASSYGGRNSRVAQEWTRRQVEGTPATWDELEAEMLKGQKMQGVLTSNEVQEVLKRRGWEEQFPLLTVINRIVNGQLPPICITNYLEAVLLPVEPIPGMTTDEPDVREIPEILVTLEMLDDM